jgi:F-type H+-transporting ATPase subunit b
MALVARRCFSKKNAPFSVAARLLGRAFDEGRKRMNPQVLLNAAQMPLGAESVAAVHPMGLVDLDPTALINFGFFLVLIVVLQKFLFEPYLRVTERRASLSDGVADAAAALNAETASLNKAYEEGVASAHRQAGLKRTELLGAAHATESTLLDGARAKVAASLASRRAVIAADAAKAESELPLRAQALAVSITQRLLS